MTVRPDPSRLPSPSRSGRRPGLFNRLMRDEGGLSAVEFALIAPLMITFYFGLAEFCQGYMAQKRMGHAAAAIADLVAQTDVVTVDELDDINAIGGLIMKPFPTTALGVRVSSVTRNASGVAKVDWSRASGMSPLGSNSTVTLPTDLIVNGESVVMAEANYAYASPIKYLMPAVTNFSSKLYSRPRKVDKVGCSNCPTT